MRRLLALALVPLVVVGGTALAASLGVTTQRLTSYSAASSVPASSCTLTANADSYVDALSGNSNFGTDTSVSVKNNKAKRTFVLFDVASCVPAGAQVLTASLSLFLWSAPSSRTYDVYRVTAAWTETGITWNNQPSAAATATASVATGATDGVTLSWDVQADVAAFASGTANDGWRIRDRTETGGGTEGQFRSREWGTAAERPTLSISFYP